MDGRLFWFLIGAVGVFAWQHFTGGTGRAPS